MTLLTLLGAVAFFLLCGFLTMVAAAGWAATRWSDDSTLAAWIVTIVTGLAWVLFFHSLPIKVTLTG